MTYPNGYTVTNYYSNGYLKYVRGSDGKVHYAINDMNAFGEVSQARFANGVSTKIGYDSAGFVGMIVSYTDTPLIANVQRVDYTYDALGNVLTRDDSSIDGHYIGERFTYDAMNRLTSFRVDTGIGVR